MVETVHGHGVRKCRVWQSRSQIVAIPMNPTISPCRLIARDDSHLHDLSSSHLFKFPQQH